MKFSSLLVLAMVASLSACAVSGHRSANVYSSRQMQNEQSVRYGYVEAVREVQIDKGRSGVGTAAGAALGGLAAGSAIGKGNGSLAAGIAGAVVGGIIGQNIEKNAVMERGLEITVKLDNGDLKAITQEADQPFRVGDRVRLLSDGRTTRVVLY